MAVRKKVAEKPATDVRLSLALFMHDLMTYLLHATDRNPADPKASEALNRMDMQRRSIQRELGLEETKLNDPAGRIISENTSAKDTK